MMQTPYNLNKCVALQSSGQRELQETSWMQETPEKPPKKGRRDIDEPVIAHIPTPRHVRRKTMYGSCISNLF